MLRLLLTLALCCVPFAVNASGPRQSMEIQYVLISFDGAHDNQQWERALAMADKSGARFTFFLSCTFLLSPETKNTYTAPHQPPGASNVGFAKSREEVAERLDHIITAYRRGNEIASHGCGHFDGKDWSAADWGKEFDSFARVLRATHKINGLDPAPADWARMADSVTGFRAPYLSTSDVLFSAERAKGYRYDASTVSRDPARRETRDGLAFMPLPMIPEGPAGRRIIAMDYNWYVRHSAGLERRSQAAEFEERAYSALISEFEHQYGGERRPVQAGFHFTLMNGGAYWNALERFLAQVCDRDNVACVPIAKYMAATSSPCGDEGCRF